MKKLLVLFFIIILAMSVLAGCGKKKSESDILSSVKTIGDLRKLSSAEYLQSATCDGKFVYGFKLKDSIYRAVAEVPEDVEQKIYDLDYDEDYDEKLGELTSTLEISKIDNLSKLIPSQDELDKLVGKTFEELLEEGWHFGGGNYDDMEFYLNKGPFYYVATLDGKVEYTEDLDEMEAVGPLKIKSIVYGGVGDISEMDEEE